MTAFAARHCLTLALVLPISAVAATAGEDAIADCARLSSTGDRILCLENAIRRLSPTSTAAPVPEIDDAVSISVEDDTPAAIEAASPSPEETELFIADSDSGAVASEVGATPTSVTTAVPPANAPPDVELGAEQLARDDGEEEEQIRVDARIIAHTLVGTGRLRLTLDNGQVWQQTGDDDDRVARRIRGQTDIAVEMWQSRSGGYRMHLLEADRTLRVRRIR